MKKIAIVFLALLCCFGLLAGCGSDKADEKQPLKVLAIGNSCSRDSMYYLPALAKLDGYTIDAAYLDAENATLRDHAYNMTFYQPVYTLWTTDENGDWKSQGGQVSADVIAQDQWDVIILQQNPLAAGFSPTYNGDLKYLLDYMQDKTDAKILWNMSWAMADGTDNVFYTEEFNTFYDNSQARMFNAIVDCLDKYIAGNDAKYKALLDGYIPTGTAIQQLRTTLTHDKDLTVDGTHLSYDTGRLCASLTLLKTLCPSFDMNSVSADTVKSFLNTTKQDTGISQADNSSYVFEDAHVALVVDAVSSACANGIPQQLPTEPVEQSSNADITLLQATAPLKYHFPDAAVLSDGTLIVGAFESLAHRPDMELGTAQGCGGAISVWASKDNGASWTTDEPLLVVNEDQMEKWGLGNVSDRYNTLSTGSFDYYISMDPRDPNFGTVNADITGDGVAEEVLLFTFWAGFRTEHGENTIKSNSKLFMLWSIDGGNTWSAPQLIQRSKGNVVKRGNIASFSDGQILIPWYHLTTAGGLLMEFDTEQQQWVLLQESEVPNVAPEESKAFDEVSFVAPDPDSDTVFAYCRENGTLFKSLDRGMTWELIGNQDGVIHQPGFAILDEDRVFTTWALTKRPRYTYGKVFYVNGDWTDTQEQLIYESPVPGPHDMADPSCVLLADGRILVVSYDTAFRSIVGVYCDLTDPKWH